MTDRGTYIKMSDSLPEHRKIVAAGGDAAWLHVCALAYCSRNLTDGFVPEPVVPRLSDRRQPAKLARRLVEVDLWHGPGHGCKRCPQPPGETFVIHDYLEHQRSAARVAEISEKRAENGRRGGSKSRPKPKQVASGLVGEGSGSAQANGQRSFAEEVLRTSQAEEPLRGSQADADVRPPAAQADASETAQTLIAEWIEHCRKRPPDRVVGQIGRELRGLLNEGHGIADVRAGLARWHQAGQHPATLASFVNGVMNASPSGGRQSTTDERVAQAQALKDKLRGSADPALPAGTIQGRVER